MASNDQQHPIPIPTPNPIPPPSSPCPSSPSSPSHFVVEQPLNCSNLSTVTLPGEILLPTPFTKQQSIGQCVKKEVPKGTDKEREERGTLCGIGCHRSFGRAIDKFLDFLMGSAHSSDIPSPSAFSCSSSTYFREQYTPQSLEAKIELISQLLQKKPTRMDYDMQWAVKLLADATEEEKLEMVRCRVLSRLCVLITRYSNVEVAAPPGTPKTRSLSVSSADLEKVEKEGERTKEEGDDQQQKKQSDAKKSSVIDRRLEKSENGAKKRSDSAGSTRKKEGVGYGTGSTKSQWNIARTVEERALHEQHLIRLLSALVVFLWGDQLSDRLTDWEMAQAHKGGERRRSGPALLLEKMPAHLLDESVTRLIGASAVFPLLNSHLSNDSVLDVSQHMPFFHVLLELCAALASIPALLPRLVLPQHAYGKSIAKELIPKFRNNLNNYPTLISGISEADLSFMDFIRKVNDYSEVIICLARQFERQIPAEKRVKTSHCHRYFTRIGASLRTRNAAVPSSKEQCPVANSVPSLSQPNAVESLSPSAHSLTSFGSFDLSATSVGARQRNIATAQRQQTALARRLSTQQLAELNGQSPSEQYREILRELQLSTYRLLNDAGKPVHGFSFKREFRSVNPFSSTNKECTKRIAKELASMHNSLPLNVSNAIFVCMDETRCDILKVLVTGPDDTPYENGLFEFDVFFPPNYPQQPPKCSFLTTGAGKVHFNPNLYNDGKICLSILGTWEGRPEEKWNPLSSLLQVLISIQGLIFVRHPFFNEPGFEKVQGTSRGDELSRKYNLYIENATLNYAIYEQWKNGPPYFAAVIRRHFWIKRHAVIRQAEQWLKEVTENVRNRNKAQLPDMDGMADGVLSSQSLQRQTVRKLLEEFRNMENPLLADVEEQKHKLSNII